MCNRVENIAILYDERNYRTTHKIYTSHELFQTQPPSPQTPKKQRHFQYVRDSKTKQRKSCVEVNADTYFLRLYNFSNIDSQIRYYIHIHK